MAENAEQTTPKYYRFKRRTIGNMLAVAKVLNNFTKTSITGGISVFAGTWLAGSKIVLLFPIILGIIGFWSAIIKDLLEWIVSVSDVED